MTTSPTPQFEIPNEMRDVAERNVERAKLAINSFTQAAQEAVSTLALPKFRSLPGCLSRPHGSLEFGNSSLHHSQSARVR
jgi:hypothetical protein